MTQDQIDTMRWIEQTLKVFDPQATVEFSNDYVEDQVVLKATFLKDGREMTKYVTVHSSGKPAWDGEGRP